MLSKKAAGLAAQKGYTNVSVFVDGIPAWVKEGYPLESSSSLGHIDVPSISAAQLKETLSNVRILDIRNEDLYAMGSIKDSIRIPLEFISGRIDEIPKDRKVVVVDHAGKQVLTAARFLKSKGYEVERLQGGMMVWTKEGFPTEK